jgi:hypothetical protein
VHTLGLGNIDGLVELLCHTSGDADCKRAQFAGVDDVLPSLAAVVSHEELSVLGLMIWGERKQTQQWVEPLFASLRVSENGEELLGYYILCGDHLEESSRHRQYTEAHVRPLRRTSHTGELLRYQKAWTSCHFGDKCA